MLIQNWYPGVTIKRQASWPFNIPNPDHSSTVGRPRRHRGQICSQIKPSRCNQRIQVRAQQICLPIVIEALRAGLVVAAVLKAAQSTITGFIRVWHGLSTAIIDGFWLVRAPSNVVR